MERYLNAMLDTLVQLALAHGSTALAEHLRASIKQHGQPKLTAVTFRMVTEAAQLGPRRIQIMRSVPGCGRASRGG